MITPAQTKEICDRLAKAAKVKLFWIGDARAKLYLRGKEIGEFLCPRPYFPVSCKGGTYRFEISALREAITEEIWQRFPSERA